MSVRDPFSLTEDEIQAAADRAGCTLDEMKRTLGLVPRKCEVCRTRYIDLRNPLVCSSTLGPLSLAHCAICLHHGVEPSWMLLAIYMVDDFSQIPLDGIDPGYHDALMAHEGRYLTVKELVDG